MAKELNKKLLKFKDGMVLSDRIFNDRNFGCICGERFNPFWVEIDTELECKKCGATITFQPTK